MTGNDTNDRHIGGRFGEAAMRQVARQVLDRLGIGGANAFLLRLTNNAVFAVPEAGIVIRITRSYRLRQRVAKVAALGRWFAQINAPTIRLAPGYEEPIDVNGLQATIWTYLPPQVPKPDVTDLGNTLRSFHRLGPPDLPLPVWDPIGDARARLADAEALRDTDRRFLLDWCDHLEPQIVVLNEQAPPGLVHGDAHAGNLLRHHDGRVVLCDFDATCLGPWQVDLVAVPVGQVRFHRPGAHARLAAAYRYDVTTDPTWPILREARELKMVAAAVPLLASGPAVAHEFSVRLRSIQQRDDTARWTPFADL
ncbi:aminoglycoside phosphotransferase family protein [Micromonospora craniellae]|uniref:Aminoglycoside phosphotransferase family protein n=1 Tax=Micromonospora craniellae TaxID=2294034 RepID=A0A372FSX9_9ACTN|nr:aminoglycoside phosphotransferase family protein [Micromonospora craniellae]QOC89658.1 aminoglycoside phosphotransferase family protein [Micromonospora craniellae]RFS43619.1 aminoglycoside phosphotransferase family protein [Micromonospora craniellae]